MARDIDSRRSTSGYSIKFAGGVMTWESKLLKCVALSTTKAKFIAITEACKELLWVKKFLQELDFVEDKYLLLWIVRGLFILVRTQPFIQGLSILMPGIIGYEML